MEYKANFIKQEITTRLLGVIGINCLPSHFVRYYIIVNFFIPSVCGGEFQGPTGYITSPFYPDSYPNDRECVYVIAQPPGTRIHLEFMEFDVESHSDCMFDYLEVIKYKI